MVETIPDFTFRPLRIAMTGPESNLTESAIALRKKFNLPVNKVRESEVVFTIPFDPETESKPFGQLVTAHDRGHPVHFQAGFTNGDVYTYMGTVKDVQVRHRKNWKRPQFILTFKPLQI